MSAKNTPSAMSVKARVACVALVIAAFGELHVFGAAEAFRVFSDGKAHFVVIKGNATYYGDKKLTTQFSTSRFTSTPERVHFEFADSRAGGMAEFVSEKGEGKLICGGATGSFREFTPSDASAFRREARLESAPTPLKPLLLGLLKELQEFLFIAAHEPRAPGAQTYASAPSPRIFVGPSGALREIRGYSSSWSKEIIVYGGDIRVSIKPGAKGSGVRVQYKRKERAFGYLTADRGNLEAALGKKLYDHLFGSGPKTPCDFLLAKGT